MNKSFDRFMAKIVWKFGFFAILLMGLSASADDYAFRDFNPEMIAQAPCPSRAWRTDLFYERWAAHRVVDPPPSVQMGPLNFRGEDPALVYALMKLTSHASRGTDEHKSESYETLLEENLKKARSCRRVLCAAKIIFGQRLGPRLVYLYANYSFNSSHLRYDEASRMNLAEIEDVISALEDLPADFFPLVFNKPLVRFQHGKIPEEYQSQNPKDFKVYATERIRLFDRWSNSKSFYRRYVLVHELAHMIETSLNLDDEWKTLIKNETTFINLYAKVDSREDFAESFSAYRYTPQILLKISPARYSYLKKYVFEDKEYLKSCPQDNRAQAVLRSAAGD